MDDNAATGTLDYSTTYYAQATQGAAQTSAVFTFATPTQTAPTAVVLASGSGQVSTNDTATVTFSGPLTSSTICSTWTGTGTQTLTNATITFVNGTGGNPDTFTATAPGTTCSGGGNFGTVNSGGNYISGTVTFTGSTITWNPTADTLTFKMGNRRRHWNQEHQGPGRQSRVHGQRKCDGHVWPPGLHRELHLWEHQWLLIPVLPPALSCGPACCGARECLRLLVARSAAQLGREPVTSLGQSSSSPCSFWWSSA